MQSKLTFSKYPFLKELGLTEVNHGCYRGGEWLGTGPELTAINPTTNEPIAVVRTATAAQVNECVEAMESERVRWTKTPGPVRGEIVRQLGVALREKKDALGALITLEMGKIRSEGLGEV